MSGINKTRFMELSRDLDDIEEVKEEAPDKAIFRRVGETEIELTPEEQIIYNCMAKFPNTRYSKVTLKNMIRDITEKAIKKEKEHLHKELLSNRRYLKIKDDTYEMFTNLINTVRSK